MWLYLVASFVIWTIVSIWYVIANLGNKNNKAQWWEWVLYPPSMLIATLVGILRKLRNK